MKRRLEDIHKIVPEPLKAMTVKTIGPLRRTPASPDEAMQEIFHDIQKRRFYEDGKTFVDLVPKRRAQVIRTAYIRERNKPDFDLNNFVSRYFKTPTDIQPRPALDSTPSLAQHVTSLWKDLEIRNRQTRGSLLPLPYPYVVPGGRFKEQFYWDSYFIMLGLATEGKWRTVEGMMKNYAYMIRKFRFIPTANRTYFLSRSQPPFFSHMVELLATHKGNFARLEYLPYLVAEYSFWMKGEKRISGHANSALKRVVCMPDGALLNRYYDDKTTPRPESYDEDTKTADGDEHDRARLYLDLRAGAESGWDFSSRWLDDPSSLRTIRTTDIIPVDLNCLLYHLESTIAKAYAQLKQRRAAAWYRKRAESRALAIRQWCWDAENGYFSDFDMRTGSTTPRPTLAMLFPLYVGIASQEEARAVVLKIKEDFLQPGGLLTTLAHNGQQWDAPNGWAPLQYVAVEALETYGFHKLAHIIRSRWLHTNLLVYERYQKCVEKYNVVTPGSLGGGGEYPLQDGFGWTNGVIAVFLAAEKKQFM